MKWTTEPPVEDGFYWARAKGESNPILAKVTRWAPYREGTPCVTFFGHDVVFELGGLSLFWHGPIEVPEPPQD